MLARENNARVRGYVEQVWNRRRLDRLAEFVAKDVVLQSSPDTVGRENMKQRVAVLQNAFPPATNEPWELVADAWVWAQSELRQRMACAIPLRQFDRIWQRCYDVVVG
jgi:hypothetical protein